MSVKDCNVSQSNVGTLSVSRLSIPYAWLGGPMVSGYGEQMAMSR